MINPNGSSRLRHVMPLQAGAGAGTPWSGPEFPGPGREQPRAPVPGRPGTPGTPWDAPAPAPGPRPGQRRVTAHEQQARRMTDSLFYRIAEATGQDAGAVRDDAKRGRVLTVAEAIGYGLIHDRATRRTR